MSDKISYEPLVSVCIITYNSSKFIIEALDSVFEQTYGNIELIVSDDCSQDNTVELCRQWMDEHARRFVHAEVLTTNKNTGVSANCNRCIRFGTGKYIKYFAGDDKLLPNCIEDNVHFMLEHEDADFLFSDIQVIGVGQDEGDNIISPSVYFHHFTKFEFKFMQLVRSLLPAPSCFMTRDVYNRLGGFDESIPMMEDKPFWVKAIFANCSIQYLAKTTVQYRVNPYSLSQSKDSPNYRKLFESRRVASIYHLSKMKEISWLLWVYGKSLYAIQFDHSIKSKLLYASKYLNVYHYYFNYLIIKYQICALIK